ncbi:hypothetical protein BGW39_010959 [Mortierella sp. 14UC]|nr:hypothetical protein BGW39_010959 [Mortierella sp. 14UC]
MYRPAMGWLLDSGDHKDRHRDTLRMLFNIVKNSRLVDLQTVTWNGATFKRAPPQFN